MDYDSGYHLLFSSPKLVEDLIRHFVPETWVKPLDFSSLQRVNAKFHSEDLKRREGDIIYRVLLDNGKPVYLYLLLEFQSRADPWMAVRVGAYVFLLYQHLIKENKLTVKNGLPPVFPLVLYNGHRPWNAAISLKKLIYLPDKSSLRAFQADMRYYVIEERLHPVEPGESLSGLLFELDNCRSPEQLTRVVGRLAALVSQPEDSDIQRAFLQLVKLVLAQRQGLNLHTEDITELSEIQQMLSTRLDQWEEEMQKKGFEKGREEGVEKGIKKGIEKGRKEGFAEGESIGKQLGESTLLYRQLERRYGSLPAWVQEKLATANSQTLEHWGLVFLDTETLEDVFRE